MKRFLISLLCVALLVGCGTLFGCEKEVGGEETSAPVPDETEPPKPTALELAAEGKTGYKIIRPDNGGQLISELSKELCIYLTEISGAMFRVSSDLVARDADPDSVSEYEILFCQTNRTADDGSLDAAGNDGWCVLAEGNKIIINAKSIYSLTEAVEYFKSTLKTEDGKMIFDTSLTKTERRDCDLVGTTLRVGSYNIKHGGDVGLDFSVIAEDIKALNLDIIGFQEIDKGTTRVNGLDTPALIAEALGYEYYYFTKAINYKGGEYGTLIVSRYPIESAESYAFPIHSGREARAMGHAVVNVNGVKLDFYNTHLSYETTELVTEQFGILGEKLDGVRGFIVTGDFNTADTSYFKTIENYRLVNTNKYPTYPSSSSAIDNIVLESGWEIVESGMGPAGHSDHNMLWAEIKYTNFGD